MRFAARTAVRSSAVLAAAALAVPLWGVPSASADSASETAGSGAYFSSTGIAKPDESPAGVPNALNDAGADGVAAGNLAVAASGGQEEKVSFLFFPVDKAFDGTISKAVLTVPLVENSPENVTAGADPAKVRACMAGPEGFGGEDGAALSLAPARLCDSFAVAGKPSADGKAYVFDVSALAATWGTVNDGIALTANEGADSTPFQVVFAPAAKATLAYEYEPAAPDEALAPVVDTPVDTGSGIATEPSGGFDAGSAPVDSGGFGAVESPVVDTALPAVDAPALDSPVTAPEQAPAAAPVVLASAPKDAPMRPRVGGIVGGLLLAVVLVLLSLVMGDPRVPQASSRQTLLGRALQDRQRSAVGGLASRVAAAP